MESATHVAVWPRHNIHGQGQGNGATTYGEGEAKE